MKKLIIAVVLLSCTTGCVSESTKRAIKAQCDTLTVINTNTQDNDTRELTDRILPLSEATVQMFGELQKPIDIFSDKEVKQTIDSVVMEAEIRNRVKDKVFGWAGKVIGGGGVLGLIGGLLLKLRSGKKLYDSAVVLAGKNKDNLVQVIGAVQKAKQVLKSDANIYKKFQDTLSVVNEDVKSAVKEIKNDLT